MAGEEDKIVGKTKEGLGKLTDDEQLEAEGKVQHATGKVEEAADRIKVHAKSLRDRVTGR